jgi:hypothetical protein
MVTTETWTYDGWNLSNYVNGSRISEIRTWQGLDHIAGVNVSGNSTGTTSGTNGMFQLAQTHGEFWYPQYYTAATRLLTLHVSSNNGSTGATPTSVNQARANFDANLDFLTLLFARRRNLASLVRTMSSGQQRLGLVTVDSVIEPQLVPVTDGLLTVEFTFPDPFWRDASDSTLATLAAGFSGVVTGMANSTAPVNDVEFSIIGPVTNPRITDNESGHWVQYTGTIASGNQLVIHNTTMSIDDGTGPSWSPALIDMNHSGDTNWLTLYPAYVNGGVNITFGGSGTSGGTSLKIVGHNKYMR